MAQDSVLSESSRKTNTGLLRTAYLQWCQTPPHEQIYEWISTMKFPGGAVGRLNRTDRCSCLEVDEGRSDPTSTLYPPPHYSAFPWPDSKH